MQEIPMPNQSKVIAFDVDQASLTSLRKGLPGSLIEEVNGATAASLTRDWNPGTVDLVVVKAREQVAERSEERRVGKECRWRWGRDAEKKESAGAGTQRRRRAAAGTARRAVRQ